MLTVMKGWRTVIVNAVTGVPAAVLAVLDQIHSIDLTPLLPAGRAAAIITGLALLNVILRLITTGPVGTKD